MRRSGVCVLAALALVACLHSVHVSGATLANGWQLADEEVVFSNSPQTTLQLNINTPVPAGQELFVYAECTGFNGVMSSQDDDGTVKSLNTLKSSSMSLLWYFAAGTSTAHTRTDVIVATEVASYSCTFSPLDGSASGSYTVATETFPVIVRPRVVMRLSFAEEPAAGQTKVVAASSTLQLRATPSAPTKQLAADPTSSISILLFCNDQQTASQSYAFEQTSPIEYSFNVDASWTGVVTCSLQAADGSGALAYPFELDTSESSVSFFVGTRVAVTHQPPSDTLYATVEHNYVLNLPSAPAAGEQLSIYLVCEQVYSDYVQFKEGESSKTLPMVIPKPGTYTCLYYSYGFPPAFAAQFDMPSPFRSTCRRIRSVKSRRTLLALRCSMALRICSRWAWARAGLIRTRSAVSVPASSGVHSSRPALSGPAASPCTFSTSRSRLWPSRSRRICM